MRIQSTAGIVATLLLAALAAPAAQAAEEAASVILAVGEVYDTAPDGSRRALKDEDTVYSGDTLSTGADGYLDLDFYDDARILLRPGTQFQIKSFHFVPEAHPENAPPTPAASQESAFFRLLKGGLRALSGLIGHVQRDTYRMDTPVATIGIRGTEYEARYCAADCGDEAENGRAPEDGLYTGVTAGSIAVGNKGGETLTKVGQYAHVKDANTQPGLLKSPPAALRHMELPDQYKKVEEERERRGLHHRHHDERRERRRHKPGG